MKQKTIKTLVVLTATSLLWACSMLNFAKTDPKENISPDRSPHFNVTDVTAVLSCIGNQINKSDLPPTDFIVGSIRDQTKPIDVPGLLATDNTMMMTLALDRFGSDKISVIGKDGYETGHNLIQLAGAFTELNRTTRSNALGASARFSDFEIDMGFDTEWNHIAFDLALTQLERVVNGMTVSVSISVAGDSGDGNVFVQPNDSKSGAIAFGYRNKEGIHAAQRLLIETSLAYLISKLYQVDPTTCFNERYLKGAVVHEPDIPDFYKDRSVESYYRKKMAQSPAPEMQAPMNRPKSTASVPKSIINQPQSRECMVVDPDVGLNIPDNWQFKWTGPCNQAGYADGKGVLTLFIDGEAQYQYIGNLERGYKDGYGRMVYPSGEYRGRFEAGYPTDQGVIVYEDNAYKAKYDKRTRRLTPGSRVKIQR